jgi:hypothetical protein
VSRRLRLQYEEIRVALEVNGFEFHASQQAMLRDYQRAPRLQLGGYVLVRVTANEAIANAATMLEGRARNSQGKDFDRAFRVTALPSPASGGLRVGRHHSDEATTTH